MSLCPRHREAADKRIAAAMKHNPDKSVEWWTAWFFKECDRQIKDQQTHCEKKETLAIKPWRMK